MSGSGDIKKSWQLYDITVLRETPVEPPGPEEWIIYEENHPVTPSTSTCFFPGDSEQLLCAQTFTPDTNHKIKQINLMVGDFWEYGLTGTLNVEIRSTSAGVPTSTVLCSGSIDASLLPVWPYSFVEITLGDGYDLIAGTVYAIVINFPEFNNEGAVEDRNVIGWFYENSNIYAGGRMYNWNGATWEQYPAYADYDYYFEEKGYVE